MKVLKHSKKRQAGFIVSTELALIGSITVLGLASGLVALRDSVVGELTDLSRTISSIDQSMDFSGLSSGKASTSGSKFVDEMDSKLGDITIAHPSVR